MTRFMPPTTVRSPGMMLIVQTPSRVQSSKYGRDGSIESSTVTNGDLP
jgi:hypothetical protein